MLSTGSLPKTFSSSSQCIGIDNPIRDYMADILSKNKFHLVMFYGYNFRLLRQILRPPDLRDNFHGNDFLPSHLRWRATFMSAAPITSGWFFVQFVRNGYSASDSLIHPASVLKGYWGILFPTHRACDCII
jgi:hypothetical protein